MSRILPLMPLFWELQGRRVLLELAVHPRGSRADHAVEKMECLFRKQQHRGYQTTCPQGQAEQLEELGTFVITE